MAIDISAETRRVVYTGSAGTGPYAFAFNILVNTDIAVYYNNTELTLTTDYTVSISPDGTGSVTIVVGVNVPTTPDADDRITLVGDRTIQRTTDFTTGGPLFAESLNDELDSLTIFTQQNLEQSNRSLRAPNTDPTTIDMTLPLNTVRANKTLAFDADGNPTIGELIGDWKGDWASGVAYNKRDLIKDTTNDNVYICQVAHTSSGSLPISTNTDSAKWDIVVDAAAAGAARIAAEAAQAAAELAETNAETAETNAETAETNAAASASAASTSETNAATSESNAASSASTASTAATNAGTSETNAASSASSASTSASSASTSASTATTQASNASASASSASTSATTATTQASNASTSATNAASSASAASSSASAASTSATNAATSETNAAASATSAANSFDSFDDRYLGAKASAPTLDNDGNALITGALYWNSTTDKLFIWTGSAWNPAAFDTTGAVLSFNSRTGAITLTSSDVTDALTYTPFNNASAGALAILSTVGAAQIDDNSVGADEINVTGDGTSGQYLVSDGDGSMSWLTPPAGGVPSGTKQLFVQTTAPTGWTKDTTHNDKALRVVSGAASSGGTVAFETAFASQTPTGSVTITSVTGSAGATTLSTPQIPSHSHSYTAFTTGTRYWSTNPGGSASPGVGARTTGAAGGGGSHSHPFSFSSGSGTFSGTAIDLDVAYVDVIVATKD